MVGASPCDPLAMYSQGKIHDKGPAGALRLTVIKYEFAYPINIANYFTIIARHFREFLDCCFVAEVYFGALFGPTGVFPGMDRQPPIKIDDVY